MLMAVERAEEGRERTRFDVVISAQSSTTDDDGDDERCDDYTTWSDFHRDSARDDQTSDDGDQGETRFTRQKSSTIKEHQ
jgi:hypothetical protein